MFELKAVPAHAEVVVGESLRVRTLITNTGGEPLAVQRFPSPLVFHLHGPRGEDGALGPERFRMSEEIYLNVLADLEGDDAEPMEPVFADVAAGETFSQLQDDLRVYALEDLPPGDYELVVEYRAKGLRGESPPVPLRIVPARATAFVARYCGMSGHVALALAHASSAGVGLLLFESLDAKPRNGVFERYHDLPAGTVVEGLTLAMHTAPRGEGRWAAWLQEGALSAVKGWGTAMAGLVEGQALDLERPRLVRPGFQLPDGSGRFLVAGKRAGASCLEAWRVVHGAATREGSVTVSGTLPERLAAWSPVNGAGELWVVWSEDAGAEQRICALAWDPSASEAPSPRRLYAVDAPLRALALTPLTQRGQPRVHALFGPQPGPAADDPEQLLYVQVGLEPEPKPISTRFAPPPLGDGLPGASWALGTEGGKGLPVLARGDEKTLWTRAAEGGGWTPLALPPTIRDLHLLDCDIDGLWAAGVDPQLGVRHALLIPGPESPEPPDEEFEDEEEE